MSANSPCLRAHDLIDKLAAYSTPSTSKRRTAPPKATSSKKKAEPTKKTAMPPSRREQATCEYSESCFTCPLKDCRQTESKCLIVNRLSIDLFI